MRQSTSIATPYSSDSDNDIDLTSLKRLFKVTENVDSLALSELKNPDIKQQGSTTTHTVRFNRKLKIENNSVKFLTDAGSSLNISNRKTFDQIQESKRNLLLRNTNLKLLHMGKASCRCNCYTVEYIKYALFFFITVGKNESNKKIPAVDST